MMRMISGDERFLINQSKIQSMLPFNSADGTGTAMMQNSDTYREALQIISQLNSAQGTQAVAPEYQIRTSNNSFQNALYPAGL